MYVFAQQTSTRVGGGMQDQMDTLQEKRKTGRLVVEKRRRFEAKVNWRKRIKKKIRSILNNVKQIAFLR